MNQPVGFGRFSIHCRMAIRAWRFQKIFGLRFFPEKLDFTFWSLSP